MSYEDKKVQDEIQKLITKYSEIRSTFKEYQDDPRYRKYLAGNDNNIGTIGEYWAIRFVEQEYTQAVQPFLLERESDNVSKSEEWFDIELLHNNKKELISVKTIFEDKTATSGYIKYKEFEENTTQSIIILKLNNKLTPEELLYIKDINNNLVDGIKDYKTRWKKNNLSINFKYYNKRGFDNIFNDNIYRYVNDQFEPKISEIKNDND